MGREDSIGAESSHSNKVVIRRLSYLDLLLNGRFLLLYAKVSNGGQQKGNQRDWRRWPNQSEFFKNQGMREAKSEIPSPFKKKTKNKNENRQTKIKTKFPFASAHQWGCVGRLGLQPPGGEEGCQAPNKVNEGSLQGKHPLGPKAHRRNQTRDMVIQTKHGDI